MKNSILTIILILGILVLGFLYIKEKNRVDYEPLTEVEQTTPTNNNQSNTNSGNTTTPTNQPTTQPQTFSQLRFSTYPSSVVSFNHATSFSGQQADFYEWRLGDDFFSKEPNFASYYRIEPVGCGSSCWGLKMVDLRDGNVYDVPNPGQADFMTQVDSKLYTNILASDPYASPTDLTTELASKNRNLKVTWYSFNETTKVFTFIKQGYCNRVNDVSGTSNTLIECIE